MRKFINIIAALVFSAGLSVLLYPFVSNTWNTYRQSRLMNAYVETVQGDAGDDYQEEWEKAWKFNAELLPMILPDSFALAETEEEDEEYLSLLDINGTGVMGIVEVPKINIRLPIYHTTNPDVLDLGAGHLHGSSLPVGGESTHAVISAHRGLPSAAMFTDLDQLVEGDHFLLYILDDILCYEVDQILEVEPQETEALAVYKGEDYVTLLTCTPYGINSQRLLVRGHRVPYEKEIVEEEAEEASPGVYTNYKMWILGGVALTALFALYMAVLERRAIKKQQKQRLDEEDNQ